MKKNRRPAARTAILLICLVLLAGCSSGKGRRITCAADLAGARAAVLRGSQGETFVCWRVENADAVVLDTLPEIADALRNGSADAAVLEERAAAQLKALYPGDLTVLDDTLFTVSYAPAVRRGNTTLAESISASLARLRADGACETLARVFLDGEDIPLPEPSDHGDSAETLTLAVNAEFEPFEYQDESGNITGLSVELARRIAADLNRRLVVENVSYFSLPEVLENGSADLVLILSRTEELQKRIDFAENWYESRQVIVVKN